MSAGASWAGSSGQCKRIGERMNSHQLIGGLASAWESNRRTEADGLSAPCPGSLPAPHWAGSGLYRDGGLGGAAEAAEASSPAGQMAAIRWEAAVGRPRGDQPGPARWGLLQRHQPADRALGLHGLPRGSRQRRTIPVPGLAGPSAGVLGVAAPQAIQAPSWSSLHPGELVAGRLLVTGPGGQAAAAGIPGRSEHVGGATRPSTSPSSWRAGVNCAGSCSGSCAPARSVAAPEAACGPTVSSRAW